MSLEKEREEKERNEELNQAKLRFFTNISHEFRTPLTLIISQIDMLFQSSSLPPTLYNRIIKISKNANRMRNMISELLEFRKLEQNYVSLHVCEQNLIPFLKDIYLSYCELAAQQSITFDFHHAEENLLLWFDSNQLQKVFYNLLSNAFKYTKQGGAIELHVSSDGNEVRIKVIDTGIGLSPDDVSHIFDRFYQAENGKQVAGANPGTGLGLALSKNIIYLHHGDIAVQSQVGYGTIFTVTLLKGKNHFENDKNAILLESPDEPMIKGNFLPDSISSEEYEEMDKTFPSLKAGSYKVLIVEDNEELLQILNTLFSPFYQVILAGNGEEGLRKANEEKPDLIVSDVMMPLMSGMEMCMKIKNNIELCHIPVVLLTALDSIEYNIEGFQQGADDYISKPFNMEMLLLKVRHLIELKKKMQKAFMQSSTMGIALTEVQASSMDEELMRKAIAYIEEQIANPELSVERLSREMGMSRVNFYKKCLSITGKTPVELIRTVRLKRAAQLLEKSQMRVNEVALECGFNDVKLFRKYFKDEFGRLPSDYHK